LCFDGGGSDWNPSPDRDRDRDHDFDPDFDCGCGRDCDSTYGALCRRRRVEATCATNWVEAIGVSGKWREAVRESHPQESWHTTANRRPSSSNNAQNPESNHRPTDKTETPDASAKRTPDASALERCKNNVTDRAVADRAVAWWVVAASMCMWSAPAMDNLEARVK
jgi:hypothetical protein